MMMVVVVVVVVDSTVQFRVSRDLGLGFQDDDDAREQRARDRSLERVAASERASELRSQDRFVIHAVPVARIACCSFVLSVFFFA